SSFGKVLQRGHEERSDPPGEWFAIWAEKTCLQIERTGHGQHETAALRLPKPATGDKLLGLSARQPRMISARQEDAMSDGKQQSSHSHNNPRGTIEGQKASFRLGADLAEPQHVSRRKQQVV